MTPKYFSMDLKSKIVFQQNHKTSITPRKIDRNLIISSNILSVFQVSLVSLSVFLYLFICLFFLTPPMVHLEFTRCFYLFLFIILLFLYFVSLTLHKSEGQLISRMSHSLDWKFQYWSSQVSWERRWKDRGCSWKAIYFELVISNMVHLVNTR